MIEIAANRLAELTGTEPLTAASERICRGVVIDSRKVERDGIFVAFPGERVDGNAFAPQAVCAGAACVVLTAAPAPELIALAAEHDCLLLACEDPEEFLLRLAADYRARLGCTVIGVTGSIGKTTTKDALASLLSAEYRVHVTQGNYNNLIGMPLTILAAPADTQVMVLEMGMDGLGQIERLSRCARPDFAIITKIGTSHVGMLGSRENIARAKAEILTGMRPATPERPSKLVLSSEDDFTPFITEHFAAPAGVDVLLAGTSEAADASATDIVLSEDGCPCFNLSFKGEAPRPVRLSIPGKQSVGNALLAAAVAHELGVVPEAIAEGLARLAITGRRQEVRRARSGARVIDDSYNASPESMAAALDLLATLPCAGARIAVLGEMGELGDEAARLHALVGAYAAAIRPSLLICVGTEAASAMAEAARTMGLPAEDIALTANCGELASRFADVLGADDLMLVKGSRFVGLDRFVEEVC